MLIKNIHTENNQTPMDIKVSNGKIISIGTHFTATDNEVVIDGTNRMILPPFVESHVHLDTCLTAGEPVWTLSGTDPKRVVEG